MSRVKLTYLNFDNFMKNSNKIHQISILITIKKHEHNTHVLSIYNFICFLDKNLHLVKTLN